MIKLSKKVSVFTALILSMSCVLSGCAIGGPKEEPVQADNRILVKTQKPGTQSIQINGSFIGTVQTADDVMVVVKTGGDVTSANYEIGDIVNAGDVLFTIDDEVAQLQLETAQIAAANARAGIASAEASKVVSEKNLTSAINSHIQAINTIPTKYQQLLDSITSCKNKIKSGELSYDLAREDLSRALKKYDDAESDIDDYNEDIDDLRSDRSKLKEKMEASTDAAEIAKLKAQIESLDTAISTKRNSRNALQDSLDDLRYNGFTKAINQSNSVRTLEELHDALEQAERALSDYITYQVPVTSSSAEAAVAQADSARIQAEAGLTQANNNVKSTQIAVEQAQISLDNTIGIAPVSGTITSKGISLNNTAGQGTVAYTISSENDLEVAFYVSEAIMKNLKVGDSISVERNSVSYDAKISENTGIIDAASGLFKIKADLSDGDDKFISGTSVKITAITEKTDHAMSVPTDCLYYQDGQPFVYVVKDGYAFKVDVETGISSDEYTEILSGLDANADVIVSYASQLREGIEVKTSDDQTRDNYVPTTKEEQEANNNVNNMVNGIKTEVNVMDDNAMSASEK